MPFPLDVKVELITRCFPQQCHPSHPLSYHRTLYPHWRNVTDGPHGLETQCLRIECVSGWPLQVNEGVTEWGVSGGRLLWETGFNSQHTSLGTWMKTATRAGSTASPRGSSRCNIMGRIGQCWWGPGGRSLGMFFWCNIRQAAVCLCISKVVDWFLTSEAPQLLQILELYLFH